MKKIEHVLTINDIMLPIRRLLRSRPDSRDITARKRLRNSQTHVLLPTQALVRQTIPQPCVVRPLPHGRQTDHHARHVPVLEPSRHAARQLLRDDQVVEIVKLVSLDRAAHQLPAVQMLAGPQAHGEHVVLGHLVHESLRDVRAVELLLLRLRVDVLVDELAHGALQPSMGLAVVGTLEDRRQPQRFAVGDSREVAGLGVDDFGLLALDRADAQALVLLEDFVAVEVVECRRGVLACDLLQNDAATRVGVEEVCQVVDFVVDDTPDAVFGVVLGHFSTGEFPRGSLGCLLRHLGCRLALFWLTRCYSQSVGPVACGRILAISTRHKDGYQEDGAVKPVEVGGKGQRKGILSRRITATPLYCVNE